MKCPRCAADNPDADRFCARCGMLLASPETSAYDPQRAAELVEAAFQLSDEGKLDEAIRMAEHAVAANPRSTSAHSALGILLYRKGETERTIAEYRIVLSLSPESSADRTRLEEIMGRPREPAGRRWRVALAGSLVVLLALLAGTIVFIFTPAPRERPTSAVTPAPVTPRGGARPLVTTAPPPGTRPGVIAPAPPGPPIAAASPGAEERPTVVRAQPPAAMTAIPTLPPVEPGVSPITAPGTEGGPSRAQPVSEAEREARQYFLGGDYERAIESYRRTLEELPRAPARVHQDLALAYMRAGRFDEALMEYRTAAEGYREQISQGRDTPGAQHGLTVCERAIQFLEQIL